MKGKLRVILVILLVAWSITGHLPVPAESSNGRQTYDRQERQETLQQGRNDLGVAIEETTTGSISSVGCNPTNTLGNSGHSVVIKVIGRFYAERILLVKHNHWITASKRPPLYFVFALHKMRN